MTKTTKIGKKNDIIKKYQDRNHHISSNHNIKQLTTMPWQAESESSCGTDGGTSKLTKPTQFDQQVTVPDVKEKMEKAKKNGIVIAEMLIYHLNLYLTRWYCKHNPEQISYRLEERIDRDGKIVFVLRLTEEVDDLFNPKAPWLYQTGEQKDCEHRQFLNNNSK